MAERREETNYDASLPGRIRGELGGPPAAPGGPAGREPSRGRLLLAGAITLGAIAAIAFSARPRAPGGQDALAQAHRRLGERDWTGAREALDPMRTSGRLGEEARLLDETAGGMLRLEAAEKAADWVAAYDVALDLDRAWTRDGVLRAEITRRLDRARAEAMAGRKLQEGRARLEAGNPAAALDALADVPAGTACAEASRQEAARARAAMRDRAIAEAERAASEGRWEEAESALAGASAAKDPAVRALAGRIGAVRAERSALARAEALLAALRVDEACTELDRVDPKGPCEADRAALAGRLDAAGRAERAVTEARERFDRGEGREALEVLRAARGVPAAILEGIAAAVASYDAVLEALDRGDDIAALEGVRRILAMPLAPENAYRVQAERNRPALEARAAAQAERGVAEGVAHFQARRWKEARASFAEVERAVPGHPVAAAYRDRFLAVGRDLYRDGYVLKSLDPAAARGRLEESLACLPDDDPTAAKAREALAR